MTPFPEEPEARDEDVPAPEGGEASEQGNAPADDEAVARAAHTEEPATAGDATAAEPAPTAGAEDAAGEAPAADGNDATEDTSADAAADADPGAADADDAPAAPREKPAIPGADLVPDIVLEGDDAFGEGEAEDDDRPAAPGSDEDEAAETPIEGATIDLGADARYRATGKRKTAVARVILRPGTGAYTVNGKPLDVFFPRQTLTRTIRQPLETVGYEERMDVVAKIHGGGVSAQAGALRHGIARALLEADPNLRGELKRRGFLTRDARAKERRKAGLKKARKRPQFSKR